MTRSTITEYEMQRRRKMAAAECALTDAMIGHELTPLEWINVYCEKTRRMLGHGLREELETDEDSKS